MPFGIPVIIAVHDGQDIVFNDDLNLKLEPDTETETSHYNVQTDSQVSPVPVKKFCSMANQQRRGKPLSQEKTLKRLILIVLLTSSI